MLVNLKIANPLPKYYDRYINNVSETDVSKFYDDSTVFEVESEWRDYVKVANRAYAPQKWTVIELLQHVIDTERVFQYRALRIARSREMVVLSEFDEDEFSMQSNAGLRCYSDVLNEYMVVRKSTIMMFNSFNESVSDYIGRVNESIFNVNQIGLMMVGHYVHHRNVLFERYRPLI